MTKLLSCVLAVGLFVVLAARMDAADATTAYTAMRIVGKSAGDDSLSRVVEVTGRGGAPQPENWRIVLSGGGKGGTEYIVSGGRILAQKAVNKVRSMTPVHLQDLNLDSSGAFEAANSQARSVHVPFASLNYALRVNPRTGKPVWDLELFNSSGKSVGELRLAANDGNIIASTGMTPGQAEAPDQVAANNSGDRRDHDTVRPTQVPPGETSTTTATATYEERTGPTSDDDSRPSDDGGGGGFFARAGRTLDHTTDAIADTFHRTTHAVDRTVRHTGVKLQNFFTGDSDRRD